VEGLVPTIELKVFRTPQQKERVLLLMEENDLKEYVKSVFTTPTNPQELKTHKKKEVKAKQVLLESMKGHLIPHIPMK
jgi:hypothetical protein